MLLSVRLCVLMVCSRAFRRVNGSPSHPVHLCHANAALDGVIFFCLPLARQHLYQVKPCVKIFIIGSLSSVMSLLFVRQSVDN